MAVYIHNKTGAAKTYSGQEVAANSYYLIPSNFSFDFSTDNTLLADIVSGDVAISKDGNTDLSGVSTQIDWLKGFDPTPRDSAGRPYYVQSPFTDKKIASGKLYRRAHGNKHSVTPGDSSFNFVIPYNQVKINEAQILWGFEGITVDFEVFDTAQGTYSGVPNFKLNQFGFGLGVAKDYFEDISSYDADLYLGMIIKCTFHNPTQITKEVCVNLVLHEVKP